MSFTLALLMSSYASSSEPPDSENEPARSDRRRKDRRWDGICQSWSESWHAKVCHGAGKNHKKLETTAGKEEAERMGPPLSVRRVAEDTTTIAHLRSLIPARRLTIPEPSSQACTIHPPTLGMI